MDDQLKLKRMAESLFIGEYHRHVLLCIGETCCSAETGAKAWETLKDELKQRKLSLSTGPQACYRTKVQCLRVCCNGPIMVVYPEGTYYSGMDGQPIEEWIFARNPLPNSQ
jgi:NADH:ubiquinone oxidoreductase subunit E